KSFDIVSKNKTAGKYLHYYFYRVYEGCAGVLITDADEEMKIRRKCSVLEKYINAVPDNLKTGIVQYLDDEYKTIVYANSSAYRMFGYEPEEFKNKFNNRLDAILESDNETQKAKEKINALELYGPSYSFEREVYTKTGGRRRFIQNTMRVINSRELEVFQAEFIDTEELTSNRNESELINRISPYMTVKLHIKDKLHILEGNDKFFEFFGIDIGRYDGNPMLRTHEEDMNIVSRALADAAEGKDVEYVYRAIVKGEKFRTLRVIGGCLGYKMGYPVYIMMFSDITPLREMTERADFEHARFETFLKASKDIVFEYTVNSDTLKLYVTIPDSGAECIVYEKFSKSIYNGQFIHSEDAGRMLDILSGQKIENTLIRARSPGKNRQSSEDRQYIYNVSGNLIKRRGESDRFAGIMRRIPYNSATLPSEENIVKTVSAEFLKKCDHAICIDMTNGCYRHIRMKNSVMRVKDFGDYDLDIIAYARKYISRDNIAEFTAEMNRDGIKRTLADKPRNTVVFRARRGNTIGYKTAEYAYLDEKRDKVILYITDISDIYLRRSPLLNLDRDVGYNFLMRVSKDITMPLNMIISLISSAKNSAGASAQLAVYLDRINSCTASVSEFVTNIIELIRLESGRFIIDKEVFSIKDLLSGINNMTAPQANSMGISFEITAGSGLNENYTGDVFRINHMITLLIANSLRYTKKRGRIEIILDNEVTDEASHRLIIKIRDNGEGVPAGVIANLFDVYEYTDDSHINTEITLAIVRMTAEALGGKFELSSGDNRTEAVISLPVGVCVDGEVGKINRIGRRNILIVNENIVYAETIISSVINSASGVDIAVSGDNAISLYLDSTDGHYDYIFVDMGIDGNRGEDIIARIRLSNRSDSGSVKIIAVMRGGESIPEINGADEVIFRADEPERIYELFE
ncbi:MAG: PAS domain-containing sensor histidine kinase, partial [Oscillospiraceae bacterium]|nr:PAS domain-containing sensor histidine kinase [Oscillospiraceae bacterium]